MRLRLVFRRVLLLLLLVLLVPASYLAWDLWNHNFGTLEANRIYRSAQMPAADLARSIHDHQIKTVLNLRGFNPGLPWYPAERAAATEAGADLIDISVSSCEWMSRTQLKTIVRVLDTCEYPLLMHCQWGSERTGWASAIATLLRPGATLDDAKRQFSLGYLFIRAGDGKVMAEHLDQYENWLASRRWSHSPERFRLWVNDGYRPGVPNRESWPYDPKPLIVITHPQPARAPVAGKADPRVTR